MAGPTSRALDLSANAVGSVAVSASLHTADPGATGASEVSGGSPAYARKTVAYTTASGGTGCDLSAAVTFDVPASTITHYGLWDASANFLGGEALSASQTFASQGTYELTSAPITG
ncbi:MAG TPA: hypothetical protein VN088_16275 [Nocardioides sp.]|nr:hypothetical protein [Nocardioides sp.]